MNEDQMAIAIEKYYKRQKRLDVKIRKWLKIHFSKYVLYYVPILLLLLSIILCFFDNTKDFGLNVTAGMIEVAVTVFIIDKLYENRERKRRLPMNLRLFYGLNSIIASYLWIWKQLSFHYLSEYEVKNIGDLIKYHKLILERAKLGDTYTRVISKRPESFKLTFVETIYDSLVLHNEVMPNMIRCFINEYKYYIEPELYDLLMHLLENNYFSNLNYMLFVEEGLKKQNSDKEKYISKNTMIKYFNPNNSTQFSLIDLLIKYSERLYDEQLVGTTHNHNHYQFEKIYKIKEYFNKEELKEREAK